MKKHAFLIIAHNEFLVLKTLLEMLDNKNHALFVHIDLRATELFKAVQSIKLQNAELHILTNRISVYWGDISQIEVEYLLLETASKHNSYAYYHLLSGVDLPIQSPQTIQAFFEKNAGKEFVSFWHTPAHIKDLNRKIERYYFFTKYRRPGEKWHALTTPLFNILLGIQKIFGIRRKKEITFQKGSNWFSITSACCQYILERKKWVLQRFKYAFCGDEIFLQTLLYHSPFKDNIFDGEDEINGNQRKIDWKRGNPYVWQDSDYEELIQSDKLFARKFSSQTPHLLQKLKTHFQNENEIEKTMV